MTSIRPQRQDIDDILNKARGLDSIDSILNQARAKPYDPLRETSLFGSDPIEEEQKKRRDTLIADLGLERGGLAAALTDMGYSLSQDIGQAFSDPLSAIQSGFSGVGDAIMGLGGLVFQRPDRMIKSIAVDFIWKGIVMPTIGNPIALIVNSDKYTPEQKEAMIKETTSQAIGYLLGFGAFKTLKRFRNISKLEEIAKSKTAFEAASKLSSDDILKLASMSTDKGARQAILRGGAAFLAGGAPVGFLTGDTPEERFSNAVSFGITSAAVGGSIGYITRKVRGVPKNVEVEHAKGALLEVVSSRQFNDIIENASDHPANIKNILKEASSGDITKVLLSEIKPDETLVLRDYEAIGHELGKPSKHVSSKRILSHKQGDETIVFLFGDNVFESLSTRQKKQIQKYGFYENQVVDYNGQKAIISSFTKVAQDDLTPAVRLFAEDGTRIPGIIPLSKVNWLDGLTKPAKEFLQQVEDNVSLETISPVLAGLQAQRYAMVEDLTESAVRRGIDLRVMSDGRIEMWDASTQQQLGVYNSLDAIIPNLNRLSAPNKPILKQGKSTNIPILDEPAINALAHLDDPSNSYGWLGRTKERVNFRIQRFYASHQKLSEPFHYFKSVDEVKQTRGEYTEAFLEFQTRLRTSHTDLLPRVHEMNEIWEKAIKERKVVSQKEQIQLRALLAAESFEDVRSGKSKIFVDYTPTKVDFNLGDSIIAQITDNKQYRQLHELLLKTTHYAKTHGLMDYENIAREFEFMNDLATSQNVGKNVLDVAKYLYEIEHYRDKMKNNPGYTEQSVPHALRELKLKLFRTQSREEYIRSNNVRDAVVETADEIRNWLNKMADTRGIPRDSRLSSYVPHAYKWSDYDNTQILEAIGVLESKPTVSSAGVTHSKGKGSDAFNMMLIEALEPTELSVYNAMYNYYNNAYLKSGAKFESKVFLSRIAELNKKYGGPTNIITDAARVHVAEALRKPLDTEKLASEALSKFAKKINMSINDPSVGRGWRRLTAITTYSTIGYNPVQGLRDAFSMIAMYYMHYDAPATARLLSILGETKDNSLLTQRLRAVGAIPGELKRHYLDSDYVNNPPDISKTPWLGEAAHKFKEFATRQGDTAFEFTMQQEAYQAIHKAIYLERNQTFMKAVAEFSQHKNQAKFEKAIGLEVYPEPIAKLIRDLVNNKDIESAADRFAKFSQFNVGGVYGLANHPIGWSTAFGRFMGQYGKWPMWATKTMLDLLTGPAAGKAWKRMALGSVGTMAAGYVTGLNLSSWQLWPWNTVFSGGPGAQIITKTLGAFGNDPSHAEYDTQNLKRMLPLAFTDEGVKAQLRQVYLPVPFMLWNFLEGVEGFADTGVISELGTTSKSTIELLQEYPHLAAMRMAGFSVGKWKTLFGTVPISLRSRLEEE